jgi:hypothetical protein
MPQAIVLMCGSACVTGDTEGGFDFVADFRAKVLGRSHAGK